MEMKTDLERLKNIDTNCYEFFENGTIYSKWFKRVLDGCLRKDGYVVTSLKLKNGDKDEFLIHQVIAYIFCQIPSNINLNDLQVDHINGNRSDNRVENLRWVDGARNMNNPITVENIRMSSTGRKQSKETIDKRASKNRGKKRTEEQKNRISESKYKPILQFSKNGAFIREWSSIKEITEQLGYSKGNICDCCKGNRKTAYGYIWKHKE